MKERPIIFSAQMVRALLAGTKTQTRRAMKPQPSDSWSPFSFGEVHKMRDGEFVLDRNGGPIVIGYGPSNEDGDEAYPCPYGQPGDQLFVRENYRLCAEADGVPARDTNEAYRIWYEADAPHQPGFGKLRPSIHMPRWASRINLEITDIRVERLQDISDEDAAAEGCVAMEGCMWHTFEEADAGIPMHPHTARDAYEALWESINGEGSWDKNPWVWCITFRRMQ